MEVSVTDGQRHLQHPPLTWEETKPQRPGVVPSVQQQDERLHQTAVNQFVLKVTDEAGDAYIFHFLCSLQRALANIWLA